MHKTKIWLLKKSKMQKTVYSLFVLLAVFSIIAITPSAFADHSKVDINMAVGCSIAGCETNNMCYMPYNEALGAIRPLSKAPSGPSDGDPDVTV